MIRNWRKWNPLIVGIVGSILVTAVVVASDDSLAECFKAETLEQALGEIGWSFAGSGATLEAVQRDFEMAKSIAPTSPEIPVMAVCLKYGNPTTERIGAAMVSLPLYFLVTAGGFLLLRRMFSAADGEDGG